MNPANLTRVDELHRLCQQHATALGEHFESVRIFATVHCAVGDETLAIAVSSGNRYASELQVREWVTAIDQPECKEDE